MSVITEAARPQETNRPVVRSRILAATLGVGGAVVFAAWTSGLALAIDVAATGVFDDELLAPLAIVIAAAAFGLPTGFVLHQESGPAGLGLEMTALPWLLAAVLIGVACGRVLLRRSDVSHNRLSLAVVTGVGFGVSVAVVTGVAIMLTNSSAGQDVTFGVDLAAMAVRATLLCAGGAWIAQRSATTDKDAGPLGVYVHAASRAVLAFVSVVLVVGASSLAAATTGLPPAEQLVVVMAAPLLLVNVGVAALGVMTGQQVSAGSIASLDRVTANISVTPTMFDGNLPILPGDRTMLGVLMWIVVVAIVGRFVWLMWDRYSVRSLLTGVAVATTFAVSFSVTAGIAATVATTTIQAFLIAPDSLTRNVVSFRLVPDTWGMAVALILPVIATAGAVTVIRGAAQATPIDVVEDRPVEPVSIGVDTA